MPKKLTDANRLSLTRPDVAAQWHLEKNGDLTPGDVPYGSNIKRWWICRKGHDHVWDDTPNHRAISRRGCPFCSGKRVADSNRLSTNHPELVLQWHPAKNGDLTADDLTAGSNKKVWWMCPEGHEWEATIPNRRKGSGCPYCAGKLATDANRLSLRYPDVAKEWHPTRNGNLNASDVTYASNKRRWWVCDIGHEWETVVAYRTLDGTGCPVCSGKIVSDSNRLSLLYPDIAAAWHPTKNGDLTPDDVHYSSNKKRWWICKVSLDHQWDATPNARTVGRGCPFCAGKRVADSNRLSTNYPGVAREWHPTKNGDLTPDGFTVASNMKVWWRCHEGHEWEAVISSRTTLECGCPFCAGKRVTDANRLSILNPDLALQWHPFRNGNLNPDEVANASGKRAWWVCEEGHEWEAVIASRTRLGNGCPYCAGLRVSDRNRLSSLYPKLVDEWHPSANDGGPEEVSYASDRKAWWICEEGHEWDAAIASRTLIGAGCPYCSGRRTTDENRLSLVAPELVKEWHPARNVGLTPDHVSFGSGKRVWWLCQNGHEWQAIVSSRYDGNGCRQCSRQGRSRVEIYLACELAVFFDDIDPEQTYSVAIQNGRPLEVDIAIPSKGVVIEYDGAYWHEGKYQRDVDKTRMITEAGWEVLRIREYPLEYVQKSDLGCEVIFSNDLMQVKRLSDGILTHLNETFGIELPGLADYLTSDLPVNEARAREIMGQMIAKKSNAVTIGQESVEQLCLF